MNNVFKFFSLKSELHNSITRAKIKAADVLVIHQRQGAEKTMETDFLRYCYNNRFLPFCTDSEGSK